MTDATISRLSRPVFFWLACSVVALGTIAGCKSEPGVPVDNPRAYVMEKLKNAQFNTWWSPYRNNDPEFIGKVIDEVVAKLPDGLPTDSKQLDKLLYMKLELRLSSANVETEEARANILAMAEERFANPPIAIVDDSPTKPKAAVLDFHVLPGEWQKALRGGMQLYDHPALDGGELKHDVLISSLKKMQIAFPDEHVYEIRFKYFYGASRTSGWYQIVKDGGISRNTNGYMETTKIQHPWEEVIAGKLRLADLDWETFTQD